MNTLETTDEGQIVLYQPDETISLEVKIDNLRNTVWLSRDQMAHLFGRERSVIGKHIRAIFQERELCKDSVWAKFAHTASDGKVYQVDFYNLDVIISVGYRVKSNEGTRFRQWATTVLREYLLQGFSINRQLITLQERTDERFSDIQHQLDEQKQQVDFLVNIHQQPKEEIFATGCVWDAWDYISQLIRSAKERILLIDNYVDERVLTLLTKRKEGVAATIHTRYTQQLTLDLEKHNKQYPAIEYIQLSQKAHDRILIIDDTVYLLGASVKDMGSSLCAVTHMEVSPETVLGLLRS